MFSHQPVLLEEVIRTLRPAPGGVYADGTLGGGGHSEAILRAMDGRGALYGIDRDPDALAAATARLGGDAAFHALHGNFHDLPALLAGAGVSQIDGALLDLGVSSYQLDTAERGFSYHQDAPLDMRMDRTQGITAAEWINGASREDITRVLRDYGEEPWAARIAEIVLEHRAKAPLLTTGDLVRAVDAAIPRKVRDRDKGHSAQKTFQALRIAVNDELAPLERALEDIVAILRPGGRLCVITFHSLEDRIVKNTFRRLADPCTCPKGLPVCICGNRPTVGLPIRSGLAPSEDELSRNPRARSARLRAAEKLPPASEGGRRMPKLYVVATPIGNLSDASPRMAETLRSVALIAAEDTRVTGALLRHFDIQTPLTSCHRHNEDGKADWIVGRMLEEGIDVALTTDAGTPAISDPGHLLVRKAWAAGIEALAVPGPTALAAALSVSGFDAREFAFYGFLPRAAGDLREKLRAMARGVPVAVAHESPHRIIDLMEAVAEVAPDCRACVCCDLTKKYEKTLLGSPDAVLARLRENPKTEKGEYCVALDFSGMKAPEKAAEAPDASPEALYFEALLAGASPAEAGERLSALGIKKNDAKRAALRVKRFLESYGEDE